MNQRKLWRLRAWAWFAGVRVTVFHGAVMAVMLSPRDCLVAPRVYR